MGFNSAFKGLITKSIIIDSIKTCVLYFQSQLTIFPQ